MTTMAILENIPQDLLDQYHARTITSKQLSEATGYHAVSLRRAIKREPAKPQPKNKTALVQARKAFRATLAHLPVADIQRLAHVSLSTASRIKRANRPQES